jgi:hypothetical protein
MDIHRNTPAVILYPDHVIAFQHYEDCVTMALHGLVNGIVHNLVYQVMKAVYTRGPYVHARPFTNSLQTLKDLDMLGGVFPIHNLPYQKGGKNSMGGEYRGIRLLFSRGNRRRVKGGFFICGKVVDKK